MMELIKWKFGQFVERLWINRTNEHIFAVSKKRCVVCQNRTHWIHLDFAVRLHPYPHPCTMIHYHRYQDLPPTSYRIGPFL